MNILLIGKMGTGKSTFAKRYIRDRKKLVFDVNNEYRDLSNDSNEQESRVIELNHKKFVVLARSKRNTCIVFEDSTGFIAGRLGEDFTQFLVEKRHTGNVSLLIFHSISSVPPRLLQLTDYVILFKTGDEWYQVIKKYPSLYEDYLKVKSNSNPYYHKLIKI